MKEKNVFPEQQPKRHMNLNVLLSVHFGVIGNAIHACKHRALTKSCIDLEEHNAERMVNAFNRFHSLTAVASFREGLGASEQV